MGSITQPFDHIIGNNSVVNGRSQSGNDKWVQVESHSLGELPYTIEEKYALAWGAPNRYLTSLQEVARELKHATDRVLVERQPRYENVSVCTVHWEESEYQEMRTNAQKIGEVFRDHYQFTVAPVVLPSKNPDNFLNRAIVEVTQSWTRADPNADDRNLLILYYCGHGIWNQSGRWLTPHSKSENVKLDWDQFQSVLAFNDCDILLLFDCCQAISMLRKASNWKRRYEILGATNARDKALADNDVSFTTALVKELISRKEEGVAIDLLWSHLIDESSMKSHKLARQPDHRIHSDRKTWPGSIVLRPQNLARSARNDAKRIRDPKELIDSTNAVVLLAIVLKETTVTPTAQEWDELINSFTVAPTSVDRVETSAISAAQYTSVMQLVNIHSLHKGSWIMIVSLPVWLYTHLEPSISYREIAVVRSGNYWNPPANSLPSLQPSLLQKPIPVDEKGKETNHDQSPQTLKQISSSPTSQVDLILEDLPTKTSIPIGWVPLSDTARKPSIEPFRTDREDKDVPLGSVMGGFLGPFRQGKKGLTRPSLVKAEREGIRRLLPMGVSRRIREATPEQFATLADYETRNFLKYSAATGITA